MSLELYLNKNRDTIVALVGTTVYARHSRGLMVMNPPEKTGRQWLEERCFRHCGGQLSEHERVKAEELVSWLLRHDGRINATVRDHDAVCECLRCKCLELHNDSIYYARLAIRVDDEGIAIAQELEARSKAGAA